MSFRFQQRLLMQAQATHMWWHLQQWNALNSSGTKTFPKTQSVGVVTRTTDTSTRTNG